MHCQVQLIGNVWYMLKNIRYTNLIFQNIFKAINILLGILKYIENTRLVLNIAQDLRG